MRISWVKWKEYPKMKDLKFQVILNLRDEAPWRKASRSFSKLASVEHHTYGLVPLRAQDPSF